MPTEKKSKKAFLLIYEHVNDDILKNVSKSKKHKLEAAGFEVVELSVTADDLSSNEATQKEVINEIIKASEAEKGEFHLIHHGDISANAEGPKCTGEYVAECLLKAGMGKIPDLNGLLIRYVACLGDSNLNAYSFFNTLHEGGAGHFMGDALDSVRSIMRQDCVIKDFDGIYTIRKEFNNLEAGDDGKIKRGDSFAKTLPENIFIHPFAEKLSFKERKLELLVPTHAVDEYEEYIHTRYFLAPIKSAKSKISITRKPKEVKKFQEANVNGSKPKVTQTTNVKPGETSGISSDRYAPEDMPTNTTSLALQSVSGLSDPKANQTPQVKQKLKNRLKNKM